MLAAALARMGAGGPVIAITNRSISHTSGGILPASATYTLGSDGVVYRQTGSSPAVALETWDNQSATVGNYEAKVTVTSGALTSGTTGSWVSLGSSKSWDLSISAGGYDQCVFTVEIRLASSGVVLDSATITLTADAT